MDYARTTERGAQRLLILANFLDTLPQGSVYMGGWLSDILKINERIRAGSAYDPFGISDERLDLLGTGEKIRIDRSAIECGFAACAVGWACSIPEFNEQGLHLSRAADECAVPTFAGAISFAAVEDFFEIDFDVSDILFGYDSYGDGGMEPTNPSRVAARIRGYAMFGRIDL